MDKRDICVRLEDAIGLLRSAQDFKGPYVVEIDGAKTTVSREEFLSFYIDVTIEDLWDLKESIEEALNATHRHN